jgi:hypothetical protein
MEAALEGAGSIERTRVPRIIEATGGTTQVRE